MGRHPEAAPRMFRLGANIARPLLTMTTKYDVSGLDNIPDDGGFIATPNHISYFDPFPWTHVLYNRGIAPVFLAKSELFRNRALGAFLRSTGQVPVYRESARAADVLADAVRALDHGRCVAIYPEGTLTRDPDLWPMRGKTGAARLALASRRPVIPIAQWGQHKIIAPYGHVPRLVPGARKTVQVRFGPAVELSDLYPTSGEHLTTATVVEATDRIMQAITRQLEHLRGERAPGQRMDPKAHGLPTTGNFHPHREENPR